ncbi:MAG: hypothetical protein ABJO01_03925 [Parasphingorhabdus sp.]|uniref:hypothetical protein n=1 Tax=Parasphingorhabdus sp. TaxID=2709688 RepID=UPI0032969E34
MTITLAYSCIAFALILMWAYLMLRRSYRESWKPTITALCLTAFGLLPFIDQIRYLAPGKEPALGFLAIGIIFSFFGGFGAIIAIYQRSQAQLNNSI